MNENNVDGSAFGLSVLIPTYNYARFLPKAIESVLKQTVQAAEILVADDGSTDETAEVVAQYGDLIHYHRFTHQGQCSVRSRMLPIIRSNWFLNLDADNWIAPDFIDRMREAVSEYLADETFAFAYPDVELHGQGAGRVVRPEFDPQRLKYGNYVDSNSVIRTEIARRYGFDPAFNSGQGDYDFFLTLAKNGYRGARVSKALLHYRVHEGSVSRKVARQRGQRTIMRRIVHKHRDFFSPSEASAALAAADNRVLVALINSRSPFAGFGRRFADWLLFARAGLRHAEFVKQAIYCFLPHRFFTERQERTDIFYLFRDTPERREMVQQAMDGRQTGLQGGQLFGFEELHRSGIKVDCNLRLPRSGSVLETLQGWRERSYAPRTGIGLGDVCSVRSHLWQMNRAQVVLATTDNTGLPAARMKAWGRLKKPLVYMSIGLPERLMAVQAKSPQRAARYRKRLKLVNRFVAYGHAEAEWLRQWIGDEKKVRFVPFGVDTDKWLPEEPTIDGVDVLSIGSDPMRDFRLLIEYACRHPLVSVRLVTNKECVARLGPLSQNMQVVLNMPVEELKPLIASARIVVLPIKENTYSGATTTLLQCMAMGKAVAVSRVGAIRQGYGFEDRINVRWMEPGSLESLAAAADELLADSALCHCVGVSARQHVVNNLGWDRYVTEIKNILDEESNRLE